MRDKILNFVKEKGPVLPVEVSIGENSFITSAFLEELAESKEIIASKEKIGSVRLYYTKEQEAKAKERLNELGVKKETASTYASKSVKVTPELAKKREDFASRLKNIEDREKKKVQPKAPEPPKKVVKPQTAQPTPPPIKVIPKQPPLKVMGRFLKKKIAKPQISPPVVNPPNELPRDSNDFEDAAVDFLREKSIKLLSEPNEVSSKESELVVNVPSGVGPVKFLVKIREKKKLNKSDLMQYYTEALERRMPIILLLKGELATTAKAYLKEAGGFLRVKLFR